MEKIISQLKKNWQIVLIVVLATLLRVWQLDNLGIFFGDAGHDILSAIEAVENKTIPLLGIESSVPRFRQGPITVWLHMLLLLFPGRDLFIHWLVFALIGIAAVIAVYEFCTVYLNKKVALLSSLLLAVSPLAVAHSRMAYHVTPIPLMTILFLVAVVRLHQRKKRSIFWAALAWAGLFQFELATAPLILVILFILYQQRSHLTKQSLNHFLQGLVLGLLPQILHDLTHRFAHLGGFAAWVVYRVVSLAPTGEHQFSLTTVGNVSQTFFTYWGRIFSINSAVITVTVLLILAATLIVSWKKVTKHKLPIAIQATWLSTLILCCSFFIHGGPSEAYFPPFIVLLPILVGYGLSLLKGIYWRGAVLAISIFAIFTSYRIIAHNFFVGHTLPFSYEYGIGEQRQIVSFVTEQTNHNFSFTTTKESGKFANYFDNLRVIAWEQGRAEQLETGQTIFVESKQSPLNNYPHMAKISFPSADLYQLL